MTKISIAVLQTKVEALIEKQKELTARVRANERVVAIVSAIGIGAGGIVGTTAFAPKAEAQQWNRPTDWVQMLMDWENEQNRIPPSVTLESALSDLDDNFEPEELSVFVKGDDGMRIWNSIFKDQ
jgi:hypothetical protein|tara:strand:- start:101 stop:475 length:375 start_codon:yes stop_codon:yes gene_type:complete